MLLPSQFEVLVQDVRKTIEAGQVVAIFGWYGTFHNAFTKKFLSCKGITFFARTPKTLGDSVGYGMSTWCTGHTQLQGVKHKIPIYPHVLSKKDIREILRACEDVLASPCERSAHGPPCVRTDESSAHAIFMQIALADDAVLDVLTRPSRRSAMELTPEDRAMLGFVKDFTNEANSNGGRVGIKRLTAILTTCGITSTPQQLLKDGWFIGKKKKDSLKTGWYEAGPKMLELIEATPPDDLCERAEWFIARKPAVLSRQADVRARFDAAMAEIKARHQTELAAAEAAFDDEFAASAREVGEISVVEAAFEQLKAALYKK